MARILSGTLFRRCANRRPQVFPAISRPSILLSVRHRHHRNSKAELIVIDLTPSSSSSSSPSPSTSSDGEGELLMLERLEEIVHRLMLKKSTPDWLPFIPGSSFWVPPNQRPSIGEFINKMADTLTEEESLSLTTSRGWPSSSFYTQQQQEGGAHVKVSVEVNIVEGKDLSVEVYTSEEGETDGEMEDSDLDNEQG